MHQLTGPGVWKHEKHTACLYTLHGAYALVRQNHNSSTAFSLMLYAEGVLLGVGEGGPYSLSAPQQGGRIIPLMAWVPSRPDRTDEGAGVTV